MKKDKEKSLYRKVINLIKKNPDTSTTIVLWLVVVIIFIPEGKWEVPILVLIAGALYGIIYVGLWKLIYKIRNFFTKK